MPRSTQELDHLIRQVLADTEVDEVDGADTGSIVALLTNTFRGRHRRLAIGGAVLNLVPFGVGLFGVIRFVQASDLRVMFLWGTAVICCFVAVTAIKIWYWLEMMRLVLSREIKRVEPQVAQLARRFADRDEP